MSDSEESDDEWQTEDGHDFYDTHPSKAEQVKAFEDALENDRTGRMTKALLVGQDDDSDIVRSILEDALRLGRPGPVIGALMHAGAHKIIPGIGIQVYDWMLEALFSRDQAIRWTLKLALEEVNRSTLEWFLSESQIQTLML